MMSRSPAFYSPLHSMAWAGAFSGAGGGAGSSGATTPPHSATKGSYSGTFGYPPTPPKESPGAVTSVGGTPGSLEPVGGGYPETAGGGDTEGAGLELKPEMKPSADHLMQSMALSGYPGLGAGAVGLASCGGRHKNQDGKCPSVSSVLSLSMLNDHNQGPHTLLPPPPRAAPPPRWAWQGVWRGSWATTTLTTRPTRPCSLTSL